MLEMDVQKNFRRILNQLDVVRLPGLGELLSGVTGILGQRSIVTVHLGEGFLIQLQDIVHGGSGSAAQEGVGFQHDDAGTLLHNSAGSSQTGSAHAHDDNVSGHFGCDSGVSSNGLRSSPTGALL